MKKILHGMRFIKPGENALDFECCSHAYLLMSKVVQQIL
jgi:hypothetical protein